MKNRKGTASSRGITRRQFIQTTAASTALLAGATPKLRAQSPNGKLNMAVIGVSGRGGANLNGVAGENIVALCDVDRNNLAAAGERFPEAKRYVDFREMLTQDNVDAVVVSTPDHCHAVCVSGALKAGRHVYCEKPLTRTVSEARYVTELAAEKGLITQMGNQIHSHPSGNYRRVVEWIQAGAIGEVGEVHVWSSARYGRRPLTENTGPAPDNIDFDLWLGPIPEMPYRPEYVPFNWRNFWAFGGGTMADFWCHFSDLPFWALDLKYPTSVTTEGAEPDPMFVTLDLRATYEFPASSPGDSFKRGPVRFTWHQGKFRPTEALSPELLNEFGSGVLFVGSKGMLIADYTRRRLLPVDAFADFTPPEPTIADSIGHHAEWIHAIKTGGKSGTDFSYSGPLTEAGLLGLAAHRSGGSIEWDAENLRARNNPNAMQYIQHRYRDGWAL